MLALPTNRPYALALRATVGPSRIDFVLAGFVLVQSRLDVELHSTNGSNGVEKVLAKIVLAQSRLAVELHSTIAPSYIDFVLAEIVLAQTVDLMWNAIPPLPPANLILYLPLLYWCRLAMDLHSTIAHTHV